MKGFGRSSKWPSVVIESRYTDPRTTLQRYAQWWLRDSEGDVKGVITICIQKKKREIIFDFTAINERHSATLSKEDATAETWVVGAPFVIPFESLFLRPPVTPESDVEFRAEDLEYIAKSVWELQSVV